MQTLYKDLLRRFDFHIMFSLLALYITLSSFQITLGGYLEVIFMAMFVVAIIIFVSTFPKARNDKAVMTPSDKKWIERTTYAFTGLFILQYILMGSTLSYLRGYIGVLMFMINTITLVIMYRIVKK
jgi:hypothetical protein